MLVTRNSPIAVQLSDFRKPLSTLDKRVFQCSGLLDKGSAQQLRLYAWREALRDNFEYLAKLSVKCCKLPSSPSDARLDPSST